MLRVVGATVSWHNDMVDKVNIKRLQHSISLVNEKSIINKSGVKKGKINYIFSTITNDMNIQISIHVIKHTGFPYANPPPNDDDP